MKTTTLIKTWLKELRKGRGLLQLVRLFNELADAIALDKTPLMQPRLVPIRVHPPVQFRPRLNFRRPPLDSLKDSGALERIEIAVSTRRRSAA